MSTCNNALNSSKEPKTYTEKSSTARILAILYIGRRVESQINPNQSNTNPRN